MNEIQASRLVHDRYRLRFSQLLHKLNRSIVGNAACSVSKACGACRTSQGEMRGPLKEQIQNAINRALKETIGSNNQAAYINVGGRRRNRKKKKNNKKNNGVSGSAWSILNFQVDEPPARCRIDSIDRPPKVKGGGSPQVTKAKKTCKELKARLSPPRSCVKDTNLEADDKPLIGNEAAEDENEAAQADQENIDPSNMPLSSLFKTTKGKKNKSKKGKDKDANDTNVTDDATSKQDAKAEEQTPTAVSPEASDVIVTSLSDEVIKAEATTEKMAEEVEGLQEEVEDVKNDLSVEQAQATMSDTKTDTMTADDQNSAAVLYTTDTRDVSMTPGEGPQLSPPEGGEGGVVEVQPAKADGSLPPETAGREKQSLLHDHNPEGMVCCTIL